MKSSPLLGASRRFIHLARFLWLPVFLLAGACDPYKGFNEGDDSLGPVDPVVFPPTNLGTGGDRKSPGLGTFQELTAYVGGQPVGYISYSLPMLPAGSDPLRVLDDGQPYAAVPTPVAYAFDGDATNPFPANDAYACNPPAGYQFDPRRDEVDYSKQGNIFSSLPSATYAEGEMASTRYVPVVSEVRVSSSGKPCQKLKSQAQVVAAHGGMLPEPSGAYLAWLIIDPSAPVYPREAPMGVYPMGHPDAGTRHNGLGLQRWGWYKRFLLAYLDGGVIPTVDATVMGGTMEMPTMRPVKRLRPQRLFIPRQIAMGMGAAPGATRAGYDVLEARRGEATYSPLCQVWVYGDTTMPPPAVAALPRNANDILMTPGLMAAPQMPATYVYCLQVR